MSGSRKGSRRRSNPLQRLVLDLPELIERQEALGHPVICEDPGTEHGRALLLALGVTIRPRRQR
jgi:hypothetical protein